MTTEWFTPIWQNLNSLHYNRTMKNAKILIVEDEQFINRLIELVLQSDGYTNIKQAYDGKEALELLQKEQFDLILLDVMIPETDGLTLCKIIKNDLRLKSVPVIMLTAKRMEEDILQGFDSGAVDYITKPFSNKILLARIKAHLQYSLNNSQNTYKTLSIDKSNRCAKIDNNEIKLTKFEFELLLLFVTNPGRVYTRAQLLSYLRGEDGFDVSERAVDVQILNLRRKLGRLGENLETIRGVGYKLKED